jgi:hypothetical protein
MVALAGWARCSGQKFFGSFFQKRTLLLLGLRVTLLLRLRSPRLLGALFFHGFMMSNGAASGGADDTMVACVMSGDASNSRPGQAASVGGGRQRQHGSGKNGVTESVVH